jgi:hypothetical protein
VKAQLEARRDPGPRRDAQVRREQGGPGYNVARENATTCGATPEMRVARARDNCMNEVRRKFSKS